MNLAEESPADELHGADAIAVLDDALKLLSAAPRVSVPLKDIAVGKVSGKVALTVKYRGKKTNEFTVRISRAWAEIVYGRLGRVLGK